MFGLVGAFGDSYYSYYPLDEGDPCLQRRRRCFALTNKNLAFGEQPGCVGLELEHLISHHPPLSPTSSIFFFSVVGFTFFFLVQVVLVSRAFFLNHSNSSNKQQLPDRSSSCTIEIFDCGIVKSTVSPGNLIPLSYITLRPSCAPPPTAPSITPLFHSSRYHH